MFDYYCHQTNLGAQFQANIEPESTVNLHAILGILAQRRVGEIQRINR
jgi:hypothetical protein